MFASKLLQRLPRKSLTRVGRASFASRRAIGKSGVPEKPERFFRLFKTSRCGSLQEALANCSDVCRSSECKFAVPRDEKCPKLPQHPAESFKDAYRKIRDEASRLRTEVADSTSGLVSFVTKSNADRFQAESDKVNKRLKDVTRKVEDLLKVNLECGQPKRIECQRLCSRANSRLLSWKCDNEAGTREIKKRVDALRDKVAECTDRAVETIRTCVGCTTPYDTNVEVAMARHEATCLLKSLEEYMHQELGCMKKSQRQVLLENNRIMDELAAKLADEVSGLDKELDTLKKTLTKAAKGSK